MAKVSYYNKIDISILFEENILTDDTSVSTTLEPENGSYPMVPLLQDFLIKKGDPVGFHVWNETVNVFNVSSEGRFRQRLAIVGTGNRV